MGFDKGAITTTNIEGCGDACSATAGCTVATFCGGTSCTMRGFGFPVSAWGIGPFCDAIWPLETKLPLPAAPAACEVETHGPYLGGAGWPTVSSGNGSVASPFDPNLPPKLPSLPGPPTGTSLPGRFISEFGVTSFSSFESMGPTLSSDHWGAHALPMYWRSWSQDNIVVSYFGPAAVNLSVVGDARVFARQLLLSQLAAALHLKVVIETMRASNNFGLLTWQLGEIFPTGGWGSLEYAHARAATSGQVLGGRWKPMHYFFEHCYGDVMVACGSEGQCYVRNDNPMNGIEARILLDFIHVHTGDSRPVSMAAAHTVSLPSGPAAISWFCASNGTGTLSRACVPWSQLLTAAGCAAAASDCILNASVVSTPNGDILASNPSLLAPPAALLPNLRSPQLAAWLVQPPPHTGPIKVSLTAAAPALFVTLSTLAQGRFSRNAFFAPRGLTQLLFLPVEGVADQSAILNATLSVQSIYANVEEKE